jgi:uncharacterized protein YaaN involved in tellurite resistance
MTEIKNPETSAWEILMQALMKICSINDQLREMVCQSEKEIAELKEKLKGGQS